MRFFMFFRPSTDFFLNGPVFSVFLGPQGLSEGLEVLKRLVVSVEVEVQNFGPSLFSCLCFHFGFHCFGLRPLFSVSSKSVPIVFSIADSGSKFFLFLFLLFYFP